MVAAALVFGLVAVSAGVAPARGGESIELFLPAILKLEPQGQGLWGKVTEIGVPVAGILMRAVRYTQEAPFQEELATATTDSNGIYSFIGLPSVTFPAARYGFNYSNLLGNPNRIGFRQQPYAPYTAGDTVYLGTFDVKNIPLLGPAHESTVALPAQFTFGVRPATPGDVYRFRIRNPNGPSPDYDTAAGNTGEFNLGSLPFGFQFGVEYVWWIYVSGPAAGETASSYQTFRVTFMSSNAQAPAKPEVWRALWDTKPTSTDAGDPSDRYATTNQRMGSER